MHFMGCLLIKRRVMTAVAIEGEEVVRLFLNRVAAIEIGVFPHVVVVILMETLDEAIAFRVTDG
jgi:hypothetical protein